MQALKPIHANRGAITKYKKDMEDLIALMVISYLYWLTATYRANPPVKNWKGTMPANDAQKELNDLHKKWMHKFEAVALYLALRHVNKSKSITEKALANAFKEHGLKSAFKDTKVMQNTIKAIVSENVSLIKSIPEQYHTKIEGIVMRAYASGTDLETLRDEIEAVYPMTKRRATIIADDQIAKLNMAVQNIRYEEVGITKAYWVHSHLGVPRPDHLAANGKTYTISEGCLISGKYIQPGELINCKCTARAILPK